MKYLDSIHSPSDLKKLDADALPELAAEIRQVLMDTVSHTGGHLASNLGVVELTLALHRVFDSPKDKIVWDVGHQIYTHKLLTGRYTAFSTLRQENGLSGFSCPRESEHDLFFSGHSSTSVSEALGLATALSLENDKHTAIAVIGDGALTGGLAYEALNNAGRSGKRLIVILNDNEMSISKNVGSVARYLAVLRTKPGYFRLKQHTESFLRKIPLVGKQLSDFAFRVKTRLKNLIYKSTFFEDLGFRYMGPIDGHDISLLTAALEGAKTIKVPVLLHIHTIKGKGYDRAEKAPSAFHGVSEFNIDTGEPLYSGPNFSAEFGSFLCEIAAKDKRICAVTAAMSLGTGLEPFRKAYPKRFFDVGIAEEHAVTFASGLARGGMIPIFAVYSTFLQRSFDQLVHDGAMQGLHMLFAVDRAGFVGEDGISHQGILDTAFLNAIPGVTVFSPCTYAGLKHAFIEAIYHRSAVVAVRYPRGCERDFLLPVEETFAPYTWYGDRQASCVLVTYGRILSEVLRVRETLIRRGVSCAVLQLMQITPLPQEAVEAAAGANDVFFFEEGIRTGGIGESFAARLASTEACPKFHLTAVPDEFVQHASVDAQLVRYGLDYDGMLQTLEECGYGEK